MVALYMDQQMYHHFLVFGLTVIIIIIIINIVIFVLSAFHLINFTYLFHSLSP